MPPGRHNRGRYRGDDYREPVETPEQKLRNAIIKLGDNPDFLTQDLQRFSHNLTTYNRDKISIIAEAFRISVTEEPFKTPYYAALLVLLHQPIPETPVEDEQEPAVELTPIGRPVLEDFWKGFQAFLDNQAWRELRLCIHFFAHLALANIISPTSLLALLQSFAAVLEEPGVSYGRALKAGLCVGEGLLLAGRVLYAQSPETVEEIINSLNAFTDSVQSSKILVRPFVQLHDLDSSSSIHDNEVLMSLISALQAQAKSNFSEDIWVLPQPLSEFPSLSSDVAPPFDLPSVLVPPEVFEMDTELGGTIYEENKSSIKKEELPRYHLTLFDNEITPDLTTPNGYVMRSLLNDVIDIFEVNRKECARLLLEMPRWFASGVFKPKPGTEIDPADEPKFEKAWQLESTIIETILSGMLIVPTPEHKPLYYFALITELCKLSPPTVGPAVGKSIRRLHSYLTDGLDVEMAQRFSEWFAVHMSNFNFQWVWKEWVPDLALPVCHPKRTFVRRATEYEVRLAYHDRILKTLPEAMSAPEAGVMPAQAPGPEFDYDDPSNPHYDSAQSLLSLLRGRSNVTEVMNHVETMKNNFIDNGETEQRASTLIRSMVMQSLLHIGSRSFSHFLNAMERYLQLLRTISVAEGKADLLDAAGDFWRKNSQLIIVVFDKLMQYQIVDPTNVVVWAFAPRQSKRGLPGLTTDEWQLVKAAIDKSIGRVAISKRRLAALRKEEDDARARVKAGTDGGVGMDVDAEMKEEAVEQSPALATALKGYSTLTQEQKNTLARVLSEFVSALKSSSHILNDDAWHKRSSWEQPEWGPWETWGWYRHFLRLYSPHLRNYVTSLETVSFDGLEDTEATRLLKRLWSTALGQE
ncbi:hypothetical protein M422DRAFT_272943 [Sphaerobolus stellatus SS14]|uniref:MIF4G domain-containing protein n=1 Tax=Sphaerobolus stellatus (strain SS14) TaxID=990650 RepID=A0A0C9UKP4_SPHS4|nr:hypothetical protein M422DRAFT_272943 [Sphaerobolus stellatus SS14]